MQVTIRLLDPPLHEFLPTIEMTDVINQLAADTEISKERVIEKIHKLHEVAYSFLQSRISIQPNSSFQGLDLMRGRSTPCSACAVADWESCTRRSQRCRHEHSLS
jgi:hypothetical protein